MKINDVNRLQVIQSYQKLIPRPEEKKAIKPQAKDQLEISAEAQARLKQTAGDPVQRQGRIESLKEAISSGTYQVNSENIAEKLLVYWKGSPKTND